MRIPASCICENKCADQLHGDLAADQCLCFRYLDSKISPLPKSKISNLANFCGPTVQFVGPCL